MGAPVALIVVIVPLDPAYPYHRTDRPIRDVLQNHVCDALNHVEGIDYPGLKITIDIGEDSHARFVGDQLGKRLRDR